MKSDRRSVGNIMHFNTNQGGIVTKDLNKQSFDSKAGNKKFENSTLNGILKNGTSKLNGNTNGQPKNISFGEVKQ